jgi:hypothetical protein
MRAATGAIPLRPVSILIWINAQGFAARDCVITTW